MADGRTVEDRDQRDVECTVSTQRIDDQRLGTLTVGMVLEGRTVHLADRVEILGRLRPDVDSGHVVLPSCA